MSVSNGGQTSAEAGRGGDEEQQTEGGNQRSSAEGSNNNQTLTTTNEVSVDPNANRAHDAEDNRRVLATVHSAENGDAATFGVEVGK